MTLLPVQRKKVECNLDFRQLQLHLGYMLEFVGLTAAGCCLYGTIRANETGYGAWKRPRQSGSGFVMTMFAPV
jgi:hypothetical protein